MRLAKLIRWIFPCRHRNYGFPRTAVTGDMYVVCWTCKENVLYSWDEMRIVKDASVYVREVKQDAQV